MDSAEFHAAVRGPIQNYVASSGPRQQKVYENRSTDPHLPGDKLWCAWHIAKLIGMPNHSRHVGQALKFLSPNTNPPVPWHRVIGASGAISSRGPGTQGAQRQADTLTAEGVEVSTGRTGELRVDFGRWGWFPQPGQIPGQLDGDEDDGPDYDEAAS